MLRFLFASLLAVSTHALSAAPAKASRAGSPPANYLVSPFDTAVESLPSTFDGLDLFRAFEAVKKSGFRPKSEYETTADFEARKPVDAELPLYGNLKFGSNIAVVLMGEGSAMTQRYNAESKELVVTLEPKSIYSLPSFQVPYPYRLQSWRANRLAQKMGTYSGVNAFNRKALVTRMLVTNFGVLFVGHQYMSENTLTVPMDAQEAARNRNAIAVLAVGKLFAPFAHEDVRTEAPTIDFPTEILERSRLALMDVSELWVFNYRTGQIYKKFPALLK